MGRPAPSELREAVRQIEGYLRKAFGLSTAITVLSLAPIGYMRDVYGPVLNARSESALAWVTLILVLALAMSAFVEWARARVLGAASVRLAEILSPRVFDCTFRADLQRLPGARQGLVDLRIVRNFLVSPSLQALMDAPLGLFFLLLVFMIHPLMGMLSMLGAVIVFVIGWVSEASVRPLVKEANAQQMRAQQFAADAGRNAQVIEAMGMRETIRERWSQWQDKFLSYQALASAAQARGAAASKVVMLAQGSLLLGLGVLFTIMGILSPAQGAAVIIAKLLGAKALAPLMLLINSWKQVVSARDAYERLDQFLQSIPPREERMSMPAPQGHLSVEGAAVRAPGTKKTVLVDLSFTLKAGRILAVIGPSGSGKSSLARLIIGLWPPVVGSVRLDGSDVAGWDKQELGQYLGYLPQDVELFDGTLAENIARFAEPDEGKLREAAALAGLDALVASLPQGLHTPIGDGGALLSGGQRQRVGLARAFYGAPCLVVLDEPNASLDLQGEIDLHQALLTLKQRGSSVVVITHRKSVLRAADNILVLADGRPKMYGPANQVMAKLSAAKEASASPEKPTGAEAGAAVIAGTPDAAERRAA